MTREEAIDTLRHNYPSACFTDLCEAVEMAIKALSAQRKGKWIEDDDSTIRGHCSACGWESHFYEDDVIGMPFCPNCGASMEWRGEEE